MSTINELSKNNFHLPASPEEGEEKKQKPLPQPSEISIEKEGGSLNSKEVIVLQSSNKKKSKKKHRKKRAPEQAPPFFLNSISLFSKTDQEFFKNLATFFPSLLAHTSLRFAEFLGISGHRLFVKLVEEDPFFMEHKERFCGMFIEWLPGCIEKEIRETMWKNRSHFFSKEEAFRFPSMKEMEEEVGKLKEEIRFLSEIEKEPSKKGRGKKKKTKQELSVKKASEEMCQFLETFKKCLKKPFILLTQICPADFCSDEEKGEKNLSLKELVSGLEQLEDFWNLGFFSAQKREEQRTKEGFDAQRRLSENLRPFFRYLSGFVKGPSPESATHLMEETWLQISSLDQSIKQLNGRIQTQLDSLEEKDQPLTSDHSCSSAHKYVVVYTTAQQIMRFFFRVFDKRALDLFFSFGASVHCCAARIPKIMNFLVASILEGQFLQQPLPSYFSKRLHALHEDCLKKSKAMHEEQRKGLEEIYNTCTKILAISDEEKGISSDTFRAFFQTYKNYSLFALKQAVGHFKSFLDLLNEHEIKIEYLSAQEADQLYYVLKITGTLDLIDLFQNIQLILGNYNLLGFEYISHFEEVVVAFKKLLNQAQRSPSPPQEEKAEEENSLEDQVLRIEESSSPILRTSSATPRPSPEPSKRLRRPQEMQPIKEKLPEAETLRTFVQELKEQRRPIKPKVLKEELQQFSFLTRREGKGSHTNFVGPDGGFVTISHGKELPKGTRRSVISQLEQILEFFNKSKENSS